jgi:serine/threonine protein kinase
MPAEGSHFGRYRIVSRIAAGGMGEVYRAVALGVGGIERPVAVKVMKKDLASEAGFVRMFEEEAKVSFLLTHGNVVQTYDVGRIDDRYFIAMELVDGLTLSALLEKCRRLSQPLPQRHAIHVATQALRGLDYAHRARDTAGAPLGIVHRDVSPANLFVSRSGEVKVGDFGIALSALRGTKTLAGTIKGKVAYMPPEQLRAEPLDPRADVYAMGIVLFEALTLARPYSGLDACIPDILAGKHPKPREQNPEIPEELEGIVLEAMRPDREKRPGSASALCGRLEEFALRAGWALSSSAFSEFVTRLADESFSAPETPAGFAPGMAWRLIDDGHGGLPVFTTAGDSAPPSEEATAAATPGALVEEQEKPTVADESSEKPTVALKPASLRSVAPIAAASIVDLPPTRSTPPAKRRSPLVALAVVAVVVLGGVWLAMAGGEEDVDPSADATAEPSAAAVVPGTAAPAETAAPSHATATPEPIAPAAPQSAVARTAPPSSARPVPAPRTTSATAAPATAARATAAPRTTAPRTSAPPPTSAAPTSAAPPTPEPETAADTTSNETTAPAPVHGHGKKTR